MDVGSLRKIPAPQAQTKKNTLLSPAIALNALLIIFFMLFI